MLLGAFLVLFCLVSLLIASFDRRQLFGWSGLILVAGFCLSTRLFSKMEEERQIVDEPLQLRLVSPVPEIFGCPDLIRLALVNLVANSRRAAPSEPLEISAESLSRAGQPWVVMTVRDRGPSLTADQRAQMDRPFFTTKSGGRGFGLGLPTVRRVMQAHRGELRIECTPGQGTAVSLFFPVAPTANPSHAGH